MPKLMRDRNVRLGGDDFDLLTQVRRRQRRSRWINPIRCGTGDTIGADRPRLRERQMSAHCADGFVSPVVRGVLMSVDEWERREHRDADSAEQNLQ
jgi:hypothetical protein